jgi:hypothetical protein
MKPLRPIKELCPVYLSGFDPGNGRVATVVRDGTRPGTDTDLKMVEAISFEANSVKFCPDDVGYIDTVLASFVADEPACPVVDFVLYK